MRITTKIFISAFIVSFILSSCDSTEKFEVKDGEVVSTMAAGSESDEELQEKLKEIEKKEGERLRKIKENSTTLSFDKLTYDFGNVAAETDVSTEFVVTNTGDKPLIIEDVKASCGCTMPQKPEHPILPGESDVIAVTFHSKPGQVNEIKKTITVTANTEEKIHMLEIRCFVK